MGRYTTRISPHQFFAYLSGAVSRSWSDILYGTTIDQNAHTLLQAEYAPNHSNNYSITISTRKEIAWHDTSIGTTAEYSTNTSKILRQSVITNYQFNSFFISTNLAFNLIKYIRLTDNYRWTISQSKAGNYINTIRNISNETSLDVTFLPDRLLLNTTLQYTHNSGFTDRKDYTFMTLSITSSQVRRCNSFLTSITSSIQTPLSIVLIATSPKATPSTSFVQDV